MSLREVQPEDCDMLYAWSQDPATRAASIRSDPFTIEEHRAWFARKMDERVSKDLRWYILEEAARVPLALVRYERSRVGRPLWSGGPIAETDGGTEVSVVVAPFARGMKLAAVALQRSELHAQKVMPRPLVALIRPENIASIKTFEAMGYKHVRDEERMGVYLKRYEK